MVLAHLGIEPFFFWWSGHANLQRRGAGLPLRWIKRMFHPSPSDQKSGFVSSKNFYASFTTTSIPIPQGLGVGTNQDIVLVYKADDSILYESPVISRALPQTLGNQLTVLVQLYEYAAFTANRYPKSTGVISGTGLVTPVFTS